MKKIFLSLFSILLIISCSVFQETTSYEEVDDSEGKNAEEIYVFDETENAKTDSTDIKQIDSEIDNTLTKTEDKAQNTIEENKNVVIETVTEPKVTNEIEQTGNANTNIEPAESVTSYEETVTDNGIQFFVQLGAFSTLRRAERFSSQIETDVPFGMSIIFDSSRELYIVRSSPYYTRTEVESVRNELKLNRKFKDCFIVTEQN